MRPRYRDVTGNPDPYGETRKKQRGLLFSNQNGLIAKNCNYLMEEKVEFRRVLSKNKMVPRKRTLEQIGHVTLQVV